MTPIVDLTMASAEVTRWGRTGIRIGGVLAVTLTMAALARLPLVMGQWSLVAK